MEITAAVFFVGGKFTRGNDPCRVAFEPSVLSYQQVVYRMRFIASAKLCGVQTLRKFLNGAIGAVARSEMQMLNKVLDGGSGTTVEQGFRRVFGNGWPER